MIARRSQRAKRSHYDVAFYTPWIGSMLSSRKPLPPGGAETQILMLSKALAARGLRVAIIAFGVPSELPSEVDGVTIVARPPHRRRGRLLGQLVETLRIWIALSQTQSPVVVYRSAGVELGVLALYTSFTRRRMVFSTANIRDFDCTNWMQSKFDILMYRLGVYLSDVIVVQTEEQILACQESLGRRAVLIKSIAAPARAQTEEPEAFIWVGRLVSHKRPGAYLELARAVPEARFWLVGVPGAHLKSDQVIAERVVADAAEIPNLDLLSPRSHAELQRLMARAVASVNTADVEGMPNVLLEAWNKGVPALVLTYDPGGVVAANGIGGFAVGSPDKLAQLAREQWQARNDRSDLAQRCRSYVADHHAPDVVASRWAEIICGGSKSDACPPRVPLASTCVG